MRDSIFLSLFSRRRVAMRAMAIAIACELVVASVPRPAFAEPKKTVREELPPDAQRVWDHGFELVQLQRWDAAEAEFQQVYALSKNPRVLYNVGTCEKARAHYTRAIEIFKQELAEGTGKISKDDEDRLHESITGLSAFVSTLQVDVNEPGATISVDDEAVGQAPLAQPVPVNIGSRKIQATKAGFTTATESLIVGNAPAHVALHIETLVRTSIVEVRVEGAPSATVKIDGREVGPAPYKGRVAVTAEPHLFEATATGYTVASQTAIVREDEALNLTLALAKVEDMGRLSIHATIAGAVIEIDGKVVGADNWQGPIAAGTHQVTVKKAGYYTWNQDVVIARGSDRPLTAQLNEDRSNNALPWIIGSIVVIGAAAVAAGFLFAPKDQQPVQGTLPPGIVEHPAHFIRF